MADSQPPERDQMTDLMSNPTVNIEGIMSYQHAGVVARFAKEMDTTIESAERGFEALKQYLVTGLMRTSSQPSVPIDEMWHNFVLHTRDYAAFCDEFAGHFIHHQPYEWGVGGNAESNYPMVRALAEVTFGELDSAWWPLVGAECNIPDLPASECDNGGCSDRGPYDD